MREKRTATIWKYNLRVEDHQVLWIPAHSKILTVQTQRGKPCLWVQVPDKEADMVSVGVNIFGTGNPADFSGRYVGTFQMLEGDLVFHVYVTGESA